MHPSITKINDTIRAQRNAFPDFQAGDSISVYVKISEGSKERIQQFKGIVIQRRNTNTASETFTVRKLSGNIGVRRVFPLLSPSIEKIEVARRGIVRRARLFYMRNRTGKAARVKERIQ